MNALFEPQEKKRGASNGCNEAPKTSGTTPPEKYANINGLKKVDPDRVERKEIEDRIALGASEQGGRHQIPDTAQAAELKVSEMMALDHDEVGMKNEQDGMVDSEDLEVLFC